MNPWFPALVTIAIQLIVAVYVYGGLSKSNEEHERRLNKNDQDHGAIWNKVDKHTEDIGKIKGRLQMNGEHN